MAVRPLVVLPVRDGTLPSGSLETVAEALDLGADASVLLIGSTLGTAAGGLAGLVAGVHAVELAEFAPERWAELLAPVASPYEIVMLPASPDGRDLAVRLAGILERPLVAAALKIDRGSATIAAGGGLAQREVTWTAPVVATLQPNIRGAVTTNGDLVVLTSLDLAEHEPDFAVANQPNAPSSSVRLVAVTPPDAATMDLAESPRIVGGGAGMVTRDLEHDAVADRFFQLAAIGEAIGASMGATRVVTDAGFVPHARQIGTTGVVVDPDLYLAFGISGAVQHTAGLGHPDHVISVNTDPHCPMMAMANLAIIAEANATLDELALLLSSLLRNATVQNEATPTETDIDG